MASSTGVSPRPAHHLCPIGSQPFDVLGVLAGMGEGMVQLGIRQAPSVVGSGQRQEGGVATGELEQRRSHGESFAPRLESCHGVAVGNQPNGAI